MSSQRRHALLFLAAAVVFMATVVCGYGSAAPAPTADLNVPSGGGGAPQPTQAAAAPEPTKAAFGTSLPIIGEATATEEGTAEPGEGAPPPAIPESRRLTLEYPPRTRAGDSDIIRLTLEVDTLGNITPTAEIQGHTVGGQTIQIPNLYETHNVIAAARLDMAGVEVKPGEEVSEPLLPGQSVTFFWSVRPTSSGTYRGTAWLFLRFIDKATKEESRKAVAAQTVEITATDFLGFNGNLARMAGGVGSVVGAILGLPFVDDVLKWFWKRIRRGN
jgi:hypothetical protein